jgi:hypothetical protein
MRISDESTISHASNPQTMPESNRLRWPANSRFFAVVSFWTIAFAIAGTFTAKSDETTNALVLLKSHKNHLETSSFTKDTINAVISPNGKAVAFISRRLIGIWNSETGQAGFKNEQDLSERLRIAGFAFAHGSDAAITLTYAANFRRLYGFGSRTDNFTGSQYRIWLIGQNHGEASRIVSGHGLGLAGVSPNGSELFALRSDYVLERYPISLSPRICTQPDFSIPPDPKFVHVPGRFGPSSFQSLSGDGNAYLHDANEKDKSPGFLYYRIDCKTCRFVTGREITLACGKELSRPNFGADTVATGSVSHDGTSILLVFNRDSDKIFVLDSEKVTLKRTIQLTPGSKIRKLETDAAGRIAASLEGDKISVVDDSGHFILRDRKGAGGRTIRASRIVGDTLMLLIGGDKVEGELPPENQGDPSPFFVERIPLKATSKE